jgi:hypothetical protein
MSAALPIPGYYMSGPFCGSCDGELEDVDDTGASCHDCGLTFPHDESGPTFLEDDAQPCGHHPDPCRHDENAARHNELGGQRFTVEHAPCPLPAGHTSPHYDACQYAAPGDDRG